MHALIAGGGIGGLTTALQLHRLGVEVTIFESVHEIEPLGAGINLLPHGARVLVDLGLEEQLAATGIQTRRIRYMTRYGQEIYSDPCGRYAGYKWPQFSIHRGDLQMLLLDAVRERLGAERLLTGHHLTRVEQTEHAVIAHFVDRSTRRPAGVYTGDLLIAADGIHSAVRRHFYPDEGPAHFSGVMMWRGVAETEPFLDGETMIIAGNFQHKAVVYPISEKLRRQGRSLTNWVMEIRVGGDEAPEHEDWNRKGALDEFFYAFEEWTFPDIDIPAILRATDTILRYPMVDRDPLPRWSFGRVTLLGDAAHPMYPMGANGASQAILDSVALAEELQGTREENVEMALKAYEEARLEPTAEVVYSNREYGPEAMLQIVDDRIESADDRVEEVITGEEIEEITGGYRKTAGYDVEELNRKAST